MEMEERPRPAAGTGEEEILIEVAGVCGSDISGFLGHSALRRPGLVLGHELVGRRKDGSRVIANPLISCGHCEACISGTQNLCESWKLLGLGTTPGTFAESVALPSGQVYEIAQFAYVREGDPDGAACRILFTCFGWCRHGRSFAWRLWGPEQWGPLRSLPRCA